MLEPLHLDVDTYATDARHWGTSLVNNAELLIACLETARARSVVEVGAWAGDLTRLLLDWGARAGARVWAIDPAPQQALVRLDSEREDLELVRTTSHEGLQRIPAADAVIIDGDHNYYTVSEELRIVADRAGDGPLPLLLFHDVCWPHARRDDYFDPELIPPEHRQPVVANGGVFPGEPGITEGGLRYRWPAAREGGPRNGVLTAVEDFVARDADLRLAVVPVFFGFGVVWHGAVPWDDALAELLAPWDRNPLLARLEANRVLQLVSTHRLRERHARQEHLLRRLLLSRSFGIGERLSWLAKLGKPEYSKAEVRSVLEDPMA